MADFIYETHARKLRRIAIESAIAGIALTALFIVLVFPDGAGAARANASVRGGDEIYARLPAYPAPFTAAELHLTRSQLAHADLSLDTARTATDGELRRMQALSRRENPSR